MHIVGLLIVVPCTSPGTLKSNAIAGIIEPSSFNQKKICVKNQWAFSTEKMQPF